MKFRVLILLPILSLVNLTFAKDGSSVGNGGDSVHCQKSPNSPFDGPLVLDFLLEYKRDEVHHVKSWQESKTRIYENLQRLSPVLANQFDAFTESTLINRVWKPTKLRLQNIEDENIKKIIPKNCNANQLIQTVIRTYDQENIYYNYHSPIISYYRENLPLQYSFIMFHEWLWDYTTNVRQLRKLNWLIHSNKVNNLTKKVFNNLTYKVGFFNRKLPICYRSKKIQEKYKFSCKDNTLKDLIPSKLLNFADSDPSLNFRPGDLAGFFHVEKLILDNQTNFLNNTSPNSFRDFKNLKYLSLKNTNTSSFPFWFHSDFQFIEELDVRSNPISTSLCFLNKFTYLKKLNLTSEQAKFQEKFNCLSRRIQLNID